MTISALIQHFTEHELNDDSNRSWSTRTSYEIYLRRWIEPRWGSMSLAEVRTMPVEDWLRLLKVQVKRTKDAAQEMTPMADGTKAKIRNLMSVLFNHAIRWEFLNPAGTRSSWFARAQNAVAHQKSSRWKRFPRCSKYSQPSYRTMVFLAAATGLRKSELRGLKWRDVDFANRCVLVTRGLVGKELGTLKTETSRKPIPMSAELSEVLLGWWGTSSYRSPEDWVFASPVNNGKWPIWPDTAMQDYIKPAAVAAGITKAVGWHTFRHSFATLLKANGEDVKTVQEPMRHANSRVTMDIYTQGISDVKRLAQSRVAGMIAGLPVAPQVGTA